MLVSARPEEPIAEQALQLVSHLRPWARAAALGIPPADLAALDAVARQAARLRARQDPKRAGASYRGKR